MLQNISFYSEGSLIKGHLYIPENCPENTPAILLCHGFAGVKELLLPAYAQKFSEKGFIVLTFDYRGFGESEGERGALIPKNQIVDIRNAITFMQTLPLVNKQKIALWGSSYGGAHVISTLAQENRICCAVVQLAFGNGKRVISNNKSTEEIQKLTDSFQKAAEKQVTSNRVLKLGVIKFLTDEQSQEFYKEYVDSFAALKETLPYLTMKETFEYIPENLLSNITIPTFFVGAEKDSVNPIEETLSLFEKANEPKKLYIAKNATHYSVYKGDLFETVSDEQLKWFKEYLYN